MISSDCWSPSIAKKHHQDNHHSHHHYDFMIYIYDDCKPRNKASLTLSLHYGFKGISN